MKVFGLEISREKRAAGDAIITTPYESPLGLQFSNILGMSNTAMSISAVYRAVEIISDSIAMLPICVNTIDKNGHFDKVAEHSIYQIFDNKNNVISKYLLMKLLAQSVMLKGNGFAYIDRNNDGSAKSIRFLESDNVTINYNKNTNKLSYSCQPINKPYIEPINMIHLIKNSYDGVKGISIISYANRALSNAHSTENSALSFFKSGCNLAGVLTVQGQLTPQQRKDIRESWMNAYGAGGNGLAVLQGNMDYKPVQLNASDSQLIESRNFNVQDIARFFGINPVLLGDLTHSSYSTLEAAQQEFVLHTLQPYIVMFETEFTKKLLKPSESNLRVNLDENYLMKADKQSEANYYNTLVGAGIMSRNEARKALGLPCVDGADDLIIPYTDIESNTVGSVKDNSTNQ